jgi:hypothetical protein
VNRSILFSSLALILGMAAPALAQTAPTAPPPEGAPAPAVPVAAAPGAKPLLPSGQLRLIGGDLFLALPLGNLSDVAVLGIGAMGRYEQAIIPKLAVTGRIGFLYHIPKSDNGLKVTYYSIPVLAGVKYAITDAFYVAGEFGLFWNDASESVSGGGPALVGGSSSEVDAGLTAGVGYRMGLLDFRAGLQILDLGNAGDTFELTAGAGYNFWGQ